MLLGQVGAEAVGEDVHNKIKEMKVFLKFSWVQAGGKCPCMSALRGGPLLTMLPSLPVCV